MFFFLKTEMMFSGAYDLVRVVCLILVGVQGGFGLVEASLLIRS